MGKKQVCVVGSRSFLGKALSEQLSKEGFDLILIDRSDYSFPDKCFKNGFDTDLILNSDYILHCVAAGVQPRHTDSDQLILELNYEEPVRLINFLSEISYQGKLVTFGSYFELGPGRSKKQDEQSFLLPHQSGAINQYIESKRKLTSFISNSNFKNHLHLILTNIYGSEENQNRLFPYIFQCVRNNQRMKFSSGDQIRQFSFIGDIVSIIVHLLNSSASGIYNVSNPDEIQVKEAIQIAIRLAETWWDKSADFIFGEVQKRDSDMTYLALDISKLQNEFDIPTFTPLEEGLLTYRDNYGKN